MTVRKQLFLNSLLTVAIPTFSLLAFIALYMGVLRFAVTPTKGLDNTSVQSLQTASQAIDSFSDDRLTDSADERDNFTATLSSMGFQTEIRLNEKVLTSNLTADASALVESMIQNEASGIQDTGMWIQIRSTYLYFRAVDTSSGILSIAAVQATSIHSLPFIGTNSLSVFNMSMLIFVLALVALIILFSIVLFKRQIKRITVPMNALLEGVDRIENENYDTPIPPLQYSEFDQLAVNINRMQGRLRLSRSMKEEFEQNRAVMIAGISHDLRTPVTSIRGYVQGLKDGVANTPEKQSHYLNVIAKKADDIESLVESLFMISKIQMNSHQYQLIPVEIEKFLTTTLDSVSSDFDPNRVKLQFFNAADRQVWADIDAAEFSRAIRNVLLNSVKHNQDRDVVIKVTLSADTSKVLISLQDNGVGVVDSDLPFVFDLFYRADPSRNNPAEGHGLGLAIVKNIVEGHEGTIAAKNENGFVVEILIPEKKMENAHENFDC